MHMILEGTNKRCSVRSDFHNIQGKTNLNQMKNQTYMD